MVESDPFLPCGVQIFVACINDVGQDQEFFLLCLPKSAPYPLEGLTPRALPRSKYEVHSMTQAIGSPVQNLGGDQDSELPLSKCGQDLIPELLRRGAEGAEVMRHHIKQACSGLAWLAFMPITIALLVPIMGIYYLGKGWDWCVDNGLDLIAARLREAFG